MVGLHQVDMPHFRGAIIMLRGGSTKGMLQCGSTKACCMVAVSQVCRTLTTERKNMQRGSSTKHLLHRSTTYNTVAAQETKIKTKLTVVWLHQEGVLPFHGT